MLKVSNALAQEAGRFSAGPQMALFGGDSTAPSYSHAQRSFPADLVVFVPRPESLEGCARRQHILIGVSPANDLHPDRQAVG
jgi:hypothetical protein